MAGLELKESDEPRSTPNAEPAKSLPDDQPRVHGERNLESQQSTKENRCDAPKPKGSTLDVSKELTNDKLANVSSDSTSDDIGLTELMGLADVGTPDDDASCDELVRDVKLLTVVLAQWSLLSTLNEPLWRARRVYRGEEKFEDYAARQLEC